MSVNNKDEEREKREDTGERGSSLSSLLTFVIRSHRNFH